MMNMPRIHGALSKFREEKPGWTVEILRAMVLCALLWVVNTFLTSRGQEEHRFTALETKTEIMQNDVKEIKDTLKLILKAVKE